MTRPPMLKRVNNDRGSDRRHALSNRLLGSLEELLETESFIEISIERLVQHAGVSRSGFYLHFSDKSDLLQAVATSVMSDLFVTAQSWWDLPARASRADLSQAIHLIVESYLPHRRLLAAVVETASYDAIVEQQYGMLMSQARDRVSESIRRAQETGDAREEVDTVRVATWITWMIERGLYRLVATAEPQEREVLEAAVAEIIWRTVYAGAA